MATMLLPSAYISLPERTPWKTLGVGEIPPHYNEYVGQSLRLLRARYSTYYRDSRIVRGLLSKQADPSVAVQAIASYDKTEPLLDAIHEGYVHAFVILDEMFQLVVPADVDTFVLRKLVQAPDQ